MSSVSPVRYTVEVLKHLAITSSVCIDGVLSPYSYLQYPILDKFSRLAASVFVIPKFSLAILILSDSNYSY